MSISQPFLSDSYVQANLVDGHGYLDVRGSLVRKFADQFENWSELDEDGSTLHFQTLVDPESPIQEVKIGDQKIWLHFRAGAAVAAIRNEAGRVLEAAGAIMGVTTFSRQGLRLQYLYPAPDVPATVRMLRAHLLPPSLGLDALGEVGGLFFQILVGAEQMKVNLILASGSRVRTHVIRQVGVAPDLELPPKDALPDVFVLADLDLFDERQTSTRDPKPHINRAMAFADESVLPLVSKLLN